MKFKQAVRFALQQLEAIREMHGPGEEIDEAIAAIKRKLGPSVDDIIRVASTLPPEELAKVIAAAKKAAGQ